MNESSLQYEARDRVGGRCCTDNISFKQKEGESFPVDLGAGWVRDCNIFPFLI